jgi:hypothetical protein
MTFHVFSTITSLSALNGLVEKQDITFQSMTHKSLSLKSLFPILRTKLYVTIIVWNCEICYKQLLLNNKFNLIRFYMKICIRMVSVNWNWQSKIMDKDIKLQYNTHSQWADIFYSQAIFAFKIQDASLIWMLPIFCQAPSLPHRTHKMAHQVSYQRQKYIP